MAYSLSLGGNQDVGKGHSPPKVWQGLENELPRWQAGASCWEEAFVPTFVGLSTGHLSVLIMWQLAPLRMGTP